MRSLAKVAILGILILYSFATILVGGIALAEYSPTKTRELGLIFHISGAISQLLAVTVIVPLTVYDLSHSINSIRKPESSFRSRISRIMGALILPVTWILLAAIPLNVAAILYYHNTLENLIITVEWLIVTTIGFLAISNFFNTRWPDKLKASLWSLFTNMALSIIYPPLLLIVAMLAVATFGRLGAQVEAAITIVILLLEFVSPPVAIIYNFVFSEAPVGNLFLAESFFIHRDYIIPMPWLVYTIVWLFVSSILLLEVRRKDGTPAVDRQPE